MLKVTIEVRIGEGGVTSEKTFQGTLTIAGNDRLEYRQPIVGTVHIAFTQVGPFQITKLVEAEQGMVAGAAEMAVEGRTFLLPVSRALQTIHFENQFLNPHSLMHLVNQLTDHVHQCGQILRLG